MNRYRTAGLAFTLMGALAGPAGAQRESAAGAAPGPPPPTRASEGGPSIEEARKDFDAVKSLRNFGSDAKAESVGVPLPKMQGRATPAPEPPPAATSAEGKRSGNWLVDAMEERATPPDQRRLDSFSARSERKADGERNPANPDAAEPREPRARTLPRNPFAPFLGDWMTPQDLALLKPGLEQASPGDRLRPNQPSFRAGEIYGSAQQEYGLNPPGSQSMAALPMSHSLAPPVNPYLDLVENPRPAPAMALPSAGPRSMPPPVTSPTIAPPLRAPAPAPRATVPEFVRPNDDAKYFKPLKRF